MDGEHPTPAPGNRSTTPRGAEVRFRPHPGRGDAGAPDRCRRRPGYKRQRKGERRVSERISPWKTERIARSTAASPPPPTLVEARAGHRAGRHRTAPHRTAQSETQATRPAPLAEKTWTRTRTRTQTQSRDGRRFTRMRGGVPGFTDVPTAAAGNGIWRVRAVYRRIRRRDCLCLED